MFTKSDMRKYDKVATADGIEIGDLLRLHHREEDVNPDLRLYATYLEVWSLSMSGHFYIPMEYVDEHTSQPGQIMLTVPLATVQNETWDRTPSFIAGRLSRREELPLPEKAVA